MTWNDLNNSTLQGAISGPQAGPQRPQRPRLSTWLRGRHAVTCLLSVGLLYTGLSVAGCSGDPGGTPTPGETPDVSSTPSGPTPTPTAPPPPDADSDGVVDEDDNCVEVANADQKDADKDGVGDACDACPSDKDNDADDDGHCADADNCPDDANANQADSDNDGDGDACDTCPEDSANDADKDGVCGDVDNCPAKSNANQSDSDSDLVGDSCDNCAAVSNGDQANSDGDTQGDLCDAWPTDPNNDSDGDGISGDVDNCPNAANTNQMDRDEDGVGDACDPCPNNNPDDNSDGSCGPVSPTPSDTADFFIYGTYPDEGYQKVPLQPSGRIYFSTNYTGDPAQVKVRLVSQNGEGSDLAVTIVNDEARFYPSLQANTDYCILTSVGYQSSVNGRWPLEHAACFTTRQPCGTPIDIGFETEVQKLGSSPGVVNALNTSIQYYGNDYPVALVMVDTLRTATFPLNSMEVVLGAYETVNTQNQLRKDGYTSTFEGCKISSSGGFTCSGPNAIFPLYLDSYGINLYVNDAVMTGTVQTTGNITTITEFTLSGIVTEDNIYRIESETGVTGIAALIRLDVDTDGDRTNDAATFEVTTQPQPLTMIDTECTAIP